MVCAVRSFENEENTEEWLQSHVCELDIQHVTNMDNVSAVEKNEGENRVKKENIESISEHQS